MEQTADFVRITDPMQGLEIMEGMVAIADVESVYGEPVQAGEHVLITAAEVTASLGYGFGGGEGPTPEADNRMGSGGGGGGGGHSSARPVAVISAGPEGVRVTPIIDVPKIALAALTMIGSLFVMASKMRREQR